jgi:hypothetical protein
LVQGCAIAGRSIKQRIACPDGLIVPDADLGHQAGYIGRHANNIGVDMAAAGP